MDFDDLDEAEASVGDAALPSAAHTEVQSCAEVAGYVPWEYFPPIRRNFRLPDFERLPAAIVHTIFGGSTAQLQTRTKVCIRAFVFYGAGDSWYAWAELAAKAPPFCEIAVHEWPAHGDDVTSRGEEDRCGSLEELSEDALRAVRESLEQHAPGGRIAGAPFVLIGHSIGCLLVVALAQKLRARLGLEPSAVIMLDRAAPHLPLHSEFGQTYREENPWDFMRDYNHPIYKAAKDASKKDPEKGRKILQTWIDDIKLANDTREVGFHTFECDLIVLRAMQNFRTAWLKDGATEEERAWHAARDRVMGSPAGCCADFSPEQFEEWSAWAKPGKFVLRDVNASHMSIKTCPEALQIVWDTLSAKRAPDPVTRVE